MSTQRVAMSIHKSFILFKNNLTRNVVQVNELVFYYIKMWGVGGGGGDNFFYNDQAITSYILLVTTCSN
jgi:hypothetical protein